MFVRRREWQAFLLAQLFDECFVTVFLFCQKQKISMRTILNIGKVLP